MKTLVEPVGITAIYARLSEDRKLEAVAVARQLRGGHALSDQNNWREREEYVDNDRSATNGDVREDYQRLLADIEVGKIARVICFHTSRLVRDREERAYLAKLGKIHKIRVYSASGQYFDLGTIEGRQMFVMMGEVDTAENEYKSERQRATYLELAEKGLPHPGGPKRFGFESDNITPIPAEIDALVQGYQLILGGGSLRGVANLWNDAGLLSGKKSYGKVAVLSEKRDQWKGPHVRGVLLNVAYRAFNDTDLTHGTRVYEDVEYKAVWPAVIDKDTWNAVRAILNDPSRRPQQGGEAMLTTVALCAVCGSTVHLGSARSASAKADATLAERRTYRCAATPGSHVSPRAMPIDRYVRALVVERMSRKDAVNLVRRSSGPDVAKLRAEREAINNEMISLAQQWVNMGMTPMQFKTANDKYKERLEHVEWQLMEATRQSVLGPLVGAANVAAVFDNMVLEQQRAVINELMQVTILRNKGHRGFRPESIQIDWRTPSQ